MIKSYFDASKTSEPGSDVIYADSDDLVISVLESMMRHKVLEFPVYLRGKCAGLICFRDLIIFLAHDLDKVDLFMHKLNYSVESAIWVLDKIKAERSLN